MPSQELNKITVQRRAEFSVLVVDHNPKLGTETVQTLKAAGFQVHLQPTFEAALAFVQLDPPHLIVIGKDVVDEAVEGFLLQIQDLSSEILTLLCCHPNQRLLALQLQQRNLVYGSVARPLATTLELLALMDQAVEVSFLTLELHDARMSFIGESPALRSHTKSPGIESPQLQSLQNLAVSLSTLKNFDQTTECFAQWLSQENGHQPCVYFRYLPGHQSLIFASSVGLQSDELRNIGLELQPEEVSELEVQVFPEAVQLRFKKLIVDVFGLDDVGLLLHEQEPGKLGGVFVILGKTDPKQLNGPMELARHIFQLNFNCNLLLKDKFNSDEVDSQSGALIKRALLKRLNDEVARARRLKLPVATIHIQFNDSLLLASRLGAQSWEAQMRAIAGVLKQTSRANDLLGRYSRDEFVLVLPHTDQTGAAIKAERLRKILAATSFPLLAKLGLGPLQASLGVSEYPGLSSDADMLLASGIEALNLVNASGGFKVCIAAPPLQFEPDFVFDRHVHLEEGL